MKKIMVEESLYEFAKRGRPRKNAKKPIKKSRGIDAPDTWGDADDDEMIDPDEVDVDTTDMETADEIAVEEDVFDDKLFKALSNEVKIPEFSRRILKFRLKGDLGKLQNGVPMAKIGDNAFLFKLKDGKMKKIFLRDIILENENASNRARMVFEGYEEEDQGREEFVRQLEELHEYDPRTDDEVEDHDCLRYINREGQCMLCGKWYEPEDDYDKGIFADEQSKDYEINI